MKALGIALFIVLFIAVPLVSVVSDSDEKLTSDALCARVHETWGERMGWKWGECEVLVSGGEPFYAVVLAQSIGPFSVGDCVSIIASMRRAVGAPIQVSARIANGDEFSPRSVSCSEFD